MSQKWVNKFHDISYNGTNKKISSLLRQKPRISHKIAQRNCTLYCTSWNEEYIVQIHKKYENLSYGFVIQYVQKPSAAYIHIMPLKQQIKYCFTRMTSSNI